MTQLTVEQIAAAREAINSIDTAMAKLLELGVITEDDDKAIYNEIDFAIADFYQEYPEEE